MVKSKAQKFAKGKSKKDTWKKLKHPDLEDFLQEQREDERLGLGEKTNDELFIIDQEGTDAYCRAARPPQTRSAKKKDKDGPLVDFSSLRCFQNFKSDSAVKDPVIKRNRVRLSHENKTVDMKLKDELRRYKKTSGKKSEGVKQSEDNFGDPWSAPDAKSVSSVLSNEWLTEETKRNLVRNRSVHKIKKPTTELKAVEAPHPGLSINPSFVDHQAILRDLVDITKSEIKKEQKLIRATAIPKDAWTGEEDVKEETEVKSEPESDDDDNKGGLLRPKPKTRQQRRKMKELNEQQKLAKDEKNQLKREAEIFRIKSLKKEIVKAEAESKKKLQKKAEKKLHHEKYGQLDLSRNKYQPLKPDPLLSDEMGGSFLADAKNSIAGLTLERFNSLQKRNLIEPTVKQRMKRKYKLKKFLRRSEKMEWEKTGMWNGEKLLIPGNQRRNHRRQ